MSSFEERVLYMARLLMFMGYGTGVCAAHSGDLLHHARRTGCAYELLSVLHPRSLGYQLYGSFVTVLVIIILFFPTPWGCGLRASR